MATWVPIAALPLLTQGAAPLGRQGKIWKCAGIRAFIASAQRGGIASLAAGGAASFAMARRSFGGAGAGCGFALLTQGAAPLGRQGRNWSCAGIRAFIASAQRGGIASLAAGGGCQFRNGAEVIWRCGRRLRLCPAYAGGRPFGTARKDLETGRSFFLRLCRLLRGIAPLAAGGPPTVSRRRGVASLAACAKVRGLAPARTYARAAPCKT